MVHSPRRGTTQRCRESPPARISRPSPGWISRDMHERAPRAHPEIRNRRTAATPSAMPALRPTARRRHARPSRQSPVRVPCSGARVLQEVYGPQPPADPRAPVAQRPGTGSDAARRHVAVRRGAATQLATARLGRLARWPGDQRRVLNMDRHHNSFFNTQHNVTI